MARVVPPVLETERLVLRGPEPDDWPGYRDLLTGPRSRWMGSGPRSEAEAWRAFGLEFGHWDLRGFGQWAVCLRDSGRSIGLVGPWHPIDYPEREIGWLLWEGEGHGYAFEAAQAALAHAFGVLGWTTAVSYIDRDNARSVALARRLGAVEDPAATRIDPEDIVFRHPAPAARKDAP